MHTETGNPLPPLALRSASVLAALSGVLLILPFRIEAAFPVTWFALVPLLLAIRGQSLRRAAVLGLLAGTVAHLLGVYWLIGTMVRFGGIYTPISYVLYVIISIAFGTIYIPYTLACRLLPQRYLDSSLRGALFIAAAFTASEFIFPGLFPWRIGYSQIPLLALVQIADLIGAYGITFLTVLASAVLYQMFIAFRRQPRRYPWRSAVALFTTFAVFLGYGVPRLAEIRDRMAGSETMKIALLQPNVAFDEKFDPALADRNIEELFTMSATAAVEQPALIIWPETGYRKPLSSETTHIDVPVAIPAASYLYLGANVFEQRGDGYNAYNSVLALTPDGTVLGRYDKRRLFPFGEYLPFSDVFPVLKKISGPISDFKAGTGPPIQTFPNGYVVGPLICYEDIFPVLSRHAVRDGAVVLVNVTNDAWFGDTAAPHQHLQLALFRSIENRRPMVRATNTGLTAVISPTGEITARAAPFTDAIIIEDIPLLSLQTFYTRHGDVFAVLCLLAVIITISWPPLLRFYRSTNRHTTQ
ncbi:MAG: Apolipoprotein N-acyltransferase [Gammaproteobacteria bacterium]|nr:Apolipoprotein N-acyltransferase [Gammaproteobacteria bacterium]